MTFYRSDTVKFEHTSGKLGNIHASENMSNTHEPRMLHVANDYQENNQCMNWRGGCERHCPGLANIPLSFLVKMISRKVEMARCHSSLLPGRDGQTTGVQMTCGDNQVTLFPAAGEDGQIVFLRLLVLSSSRICPPNIPTRKTPSTTGWS